MADWASSRRGFDTGKRSFRLLAHGAPAAAEEVQGAETEALKRGSHDRRQVPEQVTSVAPA